MRRGILTDSESDDLMINVRRDATGKITGGLVVGDSDEQHIEHNLMCNRGEIKEYPTIGGEIFKEDKGTLTETFFRKAQVSLENDGYSMKHVEFLINEKA